MSNSALSFLYIVRLVELSSNVPPSKVVSKHDYADRKSASAAILSDLPEITNNNAKDPEAEDKKNVYRKNFYVSKPFEDVNIDFKHTSTIRNALYIT
jgi:hypothetical protein